MPSYIFIYLILCLCGHLSAHSIKPKIPKLLLISFDGFRYDYVEKAKGGGKNVSAFHEMMSHGVHAKYVQGVFSSITFPSHTSIISGMYEESHGIVNNRYFDPVLNETFDKRNLEQNLERKWWNTGYEPIWITNERQGHDSAVINFPGMSTWYNGYIETYSNFIYNSKVPWTYYVNLMIGWLEKEHTTLGVLYYPEPDGTGHRYGPDSPQMLDQIEKCNGRLAYVLEKVRESSELKHDLNIMLVSDHGMAQIAKNRTIDMSKLIPQDWYHEYSSFGEALWGLWPKDGKEDAIIEAVKGQKHLKAWKRKDVPEYFHYKFNRRIPPVVILADDRWWLLANATAVGNRGGTHGYNNSLPDMHPIFMAKGPAFKSGVTVPVVHMVDFYSLMCKILDLDPHPNNGSISRIQFVLNGDHDEENESLFSTFMTYILILLPVVLISAVFSLVALQQIHYHYILSSKTNGTELNPLLTGRSRAEFTVLTNEDDSSDSSINTPSR